MLIDQDSLQTARVIRPIDHGDFVQLLCSDERGLLSVYFEIAQFEVFLNYLYKANMEVGGLQIKFDHDRVCIFQSSKFFNRRSAFQKALSA